MQTTSNEALLAERLHHLNARPGSRVGDFLQLPMLHPKLGTMTRLTHDWGNHIQTGGLNGSYYLTTHGCLSYSGSLDQGLKKADILTEPAGTKEGTVWFFDGGISGAGRGVYFKVPMRVFAIREGADLSGIGELRCPYHLTVLDEAGHRRTCNYWYTITLKAMSHTAFTTAEQLCRWLSENGLKLTKPLTKAGDWSSQSLAYA
jgi:hypothetical protein